MDEWIRQAEVWVRQAEVWVRQAESWIRQQPPEQIYVAAAVVALTILLLIIASCLKSSKPNTIVLSGLSGSGKTTIFYQLRDGSSHQGTATSMEENNDTFVLHSEQERKGKVKPVHVVDVPGHSRLKPKLDEVLPKAAGVVFVVDAQDFLSIVQAAAEYLYDILTKATVVKKKVPVLIFCNKTDKVTAHSKEFIKKQLEKELNKLGMPYHQLTSLMKFSSGYLERYSTSASARTRWLLLRVLVQPVMFQMSSNSSVNM